MARWTILLLLLLALPRPAAGTTIIALPEPDLIRHSHAIVVGTVVRTHTMVSRGGRVTTRVTLQVHQGLRGAKANQVVTIEVPGGTLASGLVASSPGAPVLRGGDMVLGFLEHDGRALRPLGLSYGLLRVRKTAGGELRVTRDTTGLELLGPNGEPVAPGAVALNDVPLEQIVARVKAQLADIPAPPPRRAVAK